MASESKTGADAEFAAAKDWADRVSRPSPVVDPDTFFSAVSQEEQANKEDEFSSLFTDDTKENVQLPSATVKPDRHSAEETLDERIGRAEATARLNELQQAYDALSTEHREVRMKFTLMSKELEAKKVSLEESWNNASEIEVELESTKELLEAAEAEGVQKSNRIITLEEELTRSEATNTAMQRDLTALMSEHENEILELKDEYAKAKEATAVKLSTLEEQKVSALKGSMQSDYDNLLKDAVARERESWEKRHRILLKDYRELEPRYKAMQDTLTEKYAALEFDQVMLKAEYEKLTNDLASEKAKAKTNRKSLKKSRAEGLSLEAKLGDAQQSISLYKDNTARSNSRIAELESRIAAMQEDIYSLKQKTHEQNLQINESKESYEALSVELKEKCKSKDEVDRVLDQLRDTHRSTKLTLAETKEELIDSQETLRQLQAKLDKKSSALQDVEQTLKVTMSHVEELQRELLDTKNESAALSGISASGALSLANASSTVYQCVKVLQDDKTLLKKLALPEISTRTAKIHRSYGNEVGLELSVDTINNNPGIRIFDIKADSLAAKAGNINIGDVIVAINGELMLESSFEEVMSAIESAGETIMFGLASGDEVDDDESPFWQGLDEDITDDEAEETREEPDASQDSISATDEIAAIVEMAAKAIKRKSELLTTSLSSLQDVTGKFTADLKETNRRVAHVFAKLNVSRRKASSYFTMHNQAVGSLKNANEEVMALKAKTISLEEQVLETEKQRDNSATLVADLGANLAEANTTATNLELELKESQNQCKDLEAVRQSMQDQIIDLNSTISKLTDTSSALSEELAITKSKLSESEEDRRELKVNNKEISEKCESLTEQQRIASEGESAMSKELVNVNGSFLAEQQKSLDLSEKLTEFQQQVLELTRDLSEAKSTIAAMEQTQEKLTSSLEQAEEDRTRIDKLLQEEELERSNLEAGLGEAINALATASEATAKVPVLEKRISTLESQEMERSQVIENLRVQGKLLMNDLEKEQENLGFAQGLLSKAGESKALLEQEIEDLKVDNANVRELLKAKDVTHNEVRKEDREKEYRAISKEAELEEKLTDTQIMLETEQNRLEELESLFTSGLVLQDQLEEQIEALKVQLRAVGAAPTNGTIRAEDINEKKDLLHRLELFHATDNVMKVFRTFGIMTRNVVLTKSRNEGLGLELCHDPSDSYKGVTVSSLKPNGIAANSKLVKVGDYVICVNGKFLLESAYEEVIREISSSGSKISLVLGSNDQMLDDDNESEADAEDDGTDE